MSINNRLTYLFKGIISFLIISGSALTANAQCFTNLNANYCIDDASVSITGSCTTYFGPGITTSPTWDPSAAGVGSHVVYGVDGLTPITTYTLDQSGTFNPIPGSGTALTLCDDCGGGPPFPNEDVNIGFTFNFYGTDYTLVNVNNNGFLQFGGSTSGIQAYTSDPLPTINPTNFIAGVWDDLDPTTGTIEYFTTGSGDFEIFVINFTGVRYFGLSTTVSFQIQLHETSNIIEIHSSLVENNASTKTQGINNSDGSNAVFVAGRNNTDWIASNDYVAFIPDNISSQAVTVNAAPDNGLTLSYNTTSVCEGETITIDISNSQMGANYQIFDQTGLTSISGVVAGNTGLAQITTTPLTTSETALILRSTFGSSGCDVDFATQAITVNPIPDISVSPTTEAICDGNSTNIALSNPNGFGDGYYWTVSSSGVSGASAQGSVGSPVTGPINQSLTLDVINVSGTVTYTIHSVNSTSGCESAARVVNVVVNPAVVADAGSTATICNGASVTLGGSPTATGGDGTYTYSWVSAPAGFTSSASNPVVSPGVTTTYTVTIDDGVCATVNDNVTITVNPIPGLPTAASPTPICVGDTDPTLTATGAGGASFNWYDDAALTSLVQGNNANYTPSVSGSAGTYVYYVTQTVSGCESAARVVNVVVNPAVVADAGTPATICNGASVTLGGSPTATGGDGTYTYSWVSVPAGFTSSASNPVVSPGVTTTYTVTIDDGVCATVNDNVTITVINFPAAPTVTNQNQSICVGDGFLLPTVTGTNLQWYSDGGLTSPIFTVDPENPTAGELGFIDSAPGIYTAFVTQSNGGCEGPATRTRLIVSPLPSNSLTLTYSNTVVCDTDNIVITIQASQTNVNYQVFDNFNSPISDVVAGNGVNINLASHPLDPTQNQLVVRAINSTTLCSSNFPPQAITVNNLPATPNISSSGSTVCDGTNPDVTLMSDLAPASGSYEWYKNGVFTGITTQTININDPAGTGNYQVLVIHGTTGCESALSAIESVTIDNLPTAPNAGPDIEQCNTPNFTMAANTPVVGSGSWIEVGGPAGIVIDTPGSPTTAVTGLTAGTSATLRWTITNGSCAIFDDVVITNVLDPIVNVISNQELCAGESTTAINFGGNASDYNWTNDQPSIGLPASGTGNIAAFTALNNTGAPIVATFEVTPSIGSCTGVSQFFTITVNPVPTIDPISSVATGTGVSVGPIALTTNTGGGETFTWSGGADIGLSDEPGAVVTEIPAFTTTNAGTTTISRVISVIAEKDGCTGPTRDFNVTVFPIPGAVAGDQIICSEDFSSILITETVTGTTFTWTVFSVTGTVSGQSGGSGNLISQQLTSATGGTVEYEIIPRANGIDGPPSYVTVQVEQQPVGNSVSESAVCSGTTLNIIPTSNVAGTTYTWTGSNGSGGSGNITDTPINATTSPTTIVYTVIPRGPAPLNCIGDPFTIDVPVDPIPQITNADLVDDFCGSGTASFTPTINVASSTYAWEATILSGTVSGVTVGIVNNSPVNELISNTGNTQAVVRYRVTPTGPVTSSCVGNFVDYVVTINPIPDVAASNQEICSGESSNVVLTNPNGVAGTIYSWTIGSVVGTVSGQSASSGSVISQVLSSANGGTVEYIITPQFNGCAGSPITRTVRVDPIPDGVDVPVGTYGICSGQSINIDPDLHLIQGTAGIYFWTGSNGSGGSGNIIDTPTNNTSSTIVISYTVVPVGPAPTNCFGLDFVIDVSVDPEPIGSDELLEICSNSGALSYDLQNNIDGNNGVASTFSWIGLANPDVLGITTSTSTDAFINDNLINRTTSDELVTYVVTPSSGGCDGTPFEVTVLVSPEPVGVAISNSLCSDEVLGTGFVLATNGTSVSASSYTIAVNANGLTQS
ncbi:MAG: PKD-like domain-containing protein, partial [Fulvivirga sp.]|uniref:PKD-like domain-containing protein n=1 Tax=Fulvivirga sp. TaxID=1931237 RepID=UPI0032EE4061